MSKRTLTLLVIDRETEKPLTVSVADLETTDPYLDAILISAAPDLLASIVEMVESYQGNTGEDVYRRACAAIAKAKGAP